MLHGLSLLWLAIAAVTLLFFYNFHLQQYLINPASSLTDLAFGNASPNGVQKSDITWDERPHAVDDDVHTSETTANESLETVDEDVHKSEIAGNESLSTLNDNVHESNITGDDNPSTADDNVLSDVAWDEGPPTGDPHGLKALCDHTKWIEGLWLQCHSYAGPNKTSANGGLNNARNRIQTCLRLAIDAGSGLILPTITIRNEEHLVQTDGGKVVCPETFWNMGHLGMSMLEQCPQLHLRFCGDVSGIDTIVPAKRRHYTSPAHHIGTFRSYTTTLLEEANITYVDSLNPVAISYGDSYIGWDYRESGELSTIRKALFKTIEYNRKLLEFGSQIFKSPQLSGGYTGVHLRGEDDWPRDFGSAADQMRLYTNEILNMSRNFSTEMKIVYISCGSEAAIQTFREKLEAFGYVVHDKWTLLAERPDLMERLKSLSFDEKAVVEYLVLLNADHWLGVLMSSFSSLVAYARTVEVEGDYFEDYVFPGSSRDGINRAYVDVPAMKGNEFTKLMAVSGVDIMDAFP